jgi:hypothetical protein
MLCVQSRICVSPLFYDHPSVAGVSRDLLTNMALLAIAAALMTMMILGAKHRHDDENEDRDDDQNHFI